VADHQPGAEASKVTITVSEQCIALAYDSAVLQAKVIQQFAHELRRRTGAHYHLMGELEVSILHAQITGQRREVAALTLRIRGTLRYQFSRQELQRIRKLVAGKTAPQALHILSGQPGIQRAAITGLGANRSLPMDGSHIQVYFLPG
jgi:hypothetical protein